MNQEKFEFYLNKIEMRFPNKVKLNAGEMLLSINMSRATFNRILKANDLHKIPLISSQKEYQRTGAPYNTYEFDVFEIAKFLTLGKEKYREIKEKELLDEKEKSRR